MPPTRCASILQSKLTFFQISYPQEHKKVVKILETYLCFVLLIGKEVLPKSKLSILMLIAKDVAVISMNEKDADQPTSKHRNRWMDYRSF